MLILCWHFDGKGKLKWTYPTWLDHKIYYMRMRTWPSFCLPLLFYLLRIVMMLWSLNASNYECNLLIKNDNEFNHNHLNDDWPPTQTSGTQTNLCSGTRFLIKSLIVLSFHQKIVAALPSLFLFDKSHKAKQQLRISMYSIIYLSIYIIKHLVQRPTIS